MSVLEQAREMAGELTRWRRDLHAHPEVGLQLPRTQEAVLAALDGLPVEISTGTAATSVTAVLRGGGDGPPVLLRADMDAIPAQELTGLPYASTVPGVMHACGHDLHTAMLLGAAHLLAARRDRLPGDVVLMFQPGEEGWEGARAMIEEGVLDAAGPRVAAAYGMHVFSTLPQRFHTRRGAMLASSSALEVTVHGEGGHASTPHLARNPVVAAAEMVLALHTLRTDVFDPVVLTTAVLHGGTRRNTIPASASFEATVRTFSEAAAVRVGDEARRLLDGIAAAHGVEVDARFVRERPATVNDADEVAFVDETVREALGEEWLRPLENPFTGAEDFSRVLAEVPGAFVALGALPDGADPAEAHFNHSGHAVFDEAVLPLGAALHAELALRRAGRPGPARNPEDQR
ncbi:MAG TPA: M20 family metallopeptidase [Pseudonocardia sp.]|uniref:M20 metallopeptidase family protein n=1 Tax=Pseudonocardia sp. TaxID=60912 RepID=UPI002B4AD889|nr:M20 family metallopeptidase [Pseudonocardia sp.]HLU59240.1 M20 family metallopeptidase [Pseudonocardia sp.]